MNKPKLLQINVVSNILSTGKIANDIACVAERNGWETYIAYGRKSRPGISTEYHIGGKVNTYCHYAYSKFFDGEGLGSVYATNRLLRKIDEIKPNIIHLHNIHDYYLNYPILFQYIEKRNIPVVWTQHDCWAFTGGCGYFDSVGCDKWKNGCQNGCLKRRSFFCDHSHRNYLLKEQYFNKSQSIVFVPVSQWLADLMSKSFLKDSDIEVIHNGIDVNRFKPLCHKDRSKKFKVLGVAAPWSERKGLNDFYELRKRLSDDFQITLVGLSESQIKVLPNGIIGIKRTSNLEELVQLYSDSDVFVNPTYSDNFPTTNIEALACGTPVITYNTGGSPEAIDVFTGISIPQGNVEKLVEKIISLRGNNFNSDLCRERAVNLYDKDKCFESYLKIYDSLLNKKNI